jgi:S-DNA-T family DNA segregation ATPase FtsK/SpoIIIE
MPGSGRTSALRAMVQAMAIWNPNLPMYFFGPARSDVAKEPFWAGTASDYDQMKALAETLKPEVGQPAPDDGPGLAIFIEAISDLINSPTESVLVDLLKMIKRNGHLAVSENDLAGWAASWPLITAARTDRRGIVMQPDAGDGDILFKVAFPRIKRSEYPAGRCIYVASGKQWTVQLPLPDATTV